jgi:hypothetical protein
MTSSNPQAAATDCAELRDTPHFDELTSNDGAAFGTANRDGVSIDL